MRGRSHTFSHQMLLSEEDNESIILEDVCRPRARTIVLTFTEEHSRKNSDVKPSSRQCRPRNKTIDICRSFSLNNIASTFIEGLKNCTKDVNKRDVKLLKTLNSAEVKLEFPPSYSDKEQLDFLNHKNTRRLAVQYSSSRKETRKTLKQCMRFIHLQSMFPWLY